MVVYTKKGDRGETGLFSKNNKRVSKDSLRINTIGSLDETSSYLGIICSDATPELKKTLNRIQSEFFTIGSILAGANLRFYSSRTKYLEKEIDRMQKQLPVAKSFIFPGGTPKGAQIFFVRTLVRRTERMLVALDEKEKIKPEILKYLNRLSDFFYILARKVNQDMGYKEEIWKPSRK
jgi:cob(I)alamin adenosyltransferase